MENEILAKELPFFSARILRGRLLLFVEEDLVDFGFEFFFVAGADGH